MRVVAAVVAAQLDSGERAVRFVGPWRHGSAYSNGRPRGGVSRTSRSADHGLAVIALDLDGFKDVNDSHGHAAGDEVLVAVAGSLAAACRSSDTLARVGGDEFAVLCEGAGAAQHAAALAERLRASLAVPVALSGGEQVAVSASVGFAVSDGADDFDALLRRADAAMYRRKEPGTAARGA